MSQQAVTRKLFNILKMRAYIGLGSNLDDPVLQVREGLRALRRLPQTHVVAESALYRSSPLGPADQPDYVNAVAALDTELGPRVLLRSLQAVEVGHGRVRGAVRWGPRILDLDILLYGDWRLTEPSLTVPHPQMTKRAFVLVPLRQIAPEIMIPGAGRVDDLLAQLPAQVVTMVGQA